MNQHTKFNKEIQAKAKVINDQLAASETILETRESEYADARDALMSIEAAWAKGDDTNTAEDHALAKATVVRAESLRNAVKAEVLALTRRQINTDTRLAEAISLPVAKVMGLKPEVYPDTPSSPPVGTRSVRLIQFDKSKLGKHDGMLSGEVRLQYFRTDYMTPLAHEPLFDAISETGTHLPGHSYGGGLIWTEDLGEGLILDQLKVNIISTYPETPTLQAKLTDVGDSLGRYIAAGYRTRFHRTTKVNANGRSRLLDTTVNKSGVYRSRILVTLTANKRLTFNGRPEERVRDMRRAFVQEVGNRVGLAPVDFTVAGIGRIESVEPLIGDDGGEYNPSPELGRLIHSESKSAMALGANALASPEHTMRAIITVKYMVA